MRIRSLLALLTLSMLPTFVAGNVSAQSLNDIKIGACNYDGFESLITNEQKRGLVIDARPFAINQSFGKVSFNGKTGRVSVLNLNPFVYKYTITVTQQELTSSAVTDFLDILLPPGLRIGSKADEKAKADDKANELQIVRKTGSDSPIARRLDHFDPANCSNPKDAGCVALQTMYSEFTLIRDALTMASLGTKLTPPQSFGTFKTNLVGLQDEEANAVETCMKAQDLNTFLNVAKPAGHLERFEAYTHVIDEITKNANDLSSLADKYLDDDELKDYVVRCDGFKCVNEFKDYAEAVVALMGIYSKDLADVTAVAEAMQRALELTEQMKTKNGVFARTIDIPKKFELTEATVSVTRTKLESKGETPAKEADDDKGTKDTGRNHSTGNGAMTEGDDSCKKDCDKDDKEKEKEKESKKGNAVTPDINESIQIGRPRFLLSGGLVFSPLRRQAFDSVKGFVRDANGNPTGDGNKSVVGFTENSPRRLLPMVMLNTRLSSFDPTSLYFSLGVTAKHDDNVDVEYLLGPSISLLNDRALFTFGGYVGKVQQLVPDVKIGDEIPDDAGDAKLFTKRYSWKPGFSFTYVFSQNERSGRSFSSGGGGTGGGGGVKNDIRIGGVSFNLAMGLAYTSLEERTYDEIVGYARDRDGNLTNGQKLTRIVGLTSSSGYRLAPLALLHTRLFDFGENHSFYFSTGVTGKKSDDKVEIEYLLGGTVNAYRRKVFVTFGAFAGKQAVLGGDFFLGAKLDKDQPVTTTTRYVWKPGFAISYDITRILKRDSQ